ncbi:ABC-2 type transport system ATP-binding protein [Archangium gephyra]|uniref:ABC-2 type transport system ATP-binding protein n=1 Tax=Archangium gephyra TaxID=48 RepID=A0AAC8QFU7_9BACT|nr:ABC transporter ATP-binding protein [Archangium gephyra]AKJ06659.1 PilH [Archangium gephyra]REG32033.1 ABC-2 type transport system ATP-binding protein [Archangium gephyra]
MDSPSPIEIRNLSKTYRLGFLMNRQVRALQSLDLSLLPGQVYGLLGPNGAGKSTTIKILLNLVQPSGGEARLFGMPPSEREARRRVGYVPENPAPYEYLTGREFVTLSGRLSGLSGKELDDRVSEVLGMVQMTRAANLQIRRYSKGMVQRVALAQALVSKPALLILDEPTSGLDPVGRRQIRDLILEERHRGTTVLFCTHIIPDVEALCDRVAVLVGGRRVREGSVAELVSSQTTHVEMTVEGLPLERIQAMGIPLELTRQLENRVLLHVRESDAQPMLKRLLEQGGRVTQLHPARFSLEELFLRALEEAKQGPVGGEIS